MSSAPHLSSPTTPDSSARRRLASAGWYPALCLAPLALLALRESAEPAASLGNPAPRADFATPPMLSSATRHELSEAGRPAHHAGNLIEGADGAPLLFWFAGSREGADDASILRASFREGKWSEPVPVLTAELASRLAGRRIAKLGNPVARRAADGRLHLYVVTVALGGWSGSRILHLTSEDEGRTFHSGRIQVLSPFFNFATLVKSPAFDADGHSYLPVYHEFIRKRSLLLELDGQGDTRLVRRFCDKDHLIQPAVTRLGDNSLLAVHRRLKVLTPRIHEQESTDGENWSDAHPGELPNPRSAVALTTLPCGNAVVAFNDGESNRNTLRLAVRSPSDERWLRVGPVISSDGEVSYPTLLAAPDALHLVYTHDRKRLVHHRIPYAQLAAPALIASEK